MHSPQHPTTQFPCTLKGTHKWICTCARLSQCGRFDQTQSVSSPKSQKHGRFLQDQRQNGSMLHVKLFEVRRCAYTTAAFASLDLISARDVWAGSVHHESSLSEEHADVRCVWHCKRLTPGMESHDTTKVSRGWKLFIFLPSLVLPARPREGARSQRRSYLRDSPSLLKPGG